MKALYRYWGYEKDYTRLDNESAYQAVVDKGFSLIDTAEVAFQPGRGFCSLGESLPGRSISCLVYQCGLI